jgi:hypothetical protein
MIIQNPGFLLCVRAIQRIQFVRLTEKPKGEGLLSVPGNQKDLRHRLKSTVELRVLCVDRGKCLYWADSAREWGSGQNWG